MIPCLWCGRPFPPRRDGGHTQRFCGTPCRRALDAGLRSWTLAELAAGRIKLSTTFGRHRLQRARCAWGAPARLPVIGAPTLRVLLNDMRARAGRHPKSINIADQSSFARRP